MSSREIVDPCFGRSRITGKRVGYRHRWSLGYGKGHCIWCLRYFDQVTQKRPTEVKQ